MLEADGSLASEEGATSTEYLFLLVLVALAIVLGTQALGGALDGAYSDAASSVSIAVNN